jgi:hypothetical protein
VVPDDGRDAGLGAGVGDDPGTQDGVLADDGGRARAGVGVADGVPLLGLPCDHVLFQPRAIAQDGAATQDGKRADLAAVPDLDRPGHPEGVGRHEHGQRAEEAAFAYPQQPEP